MPTRSIPVLMVAVTLWCGLASAQKKPKGKTAPEAVPAPVSAPIPQAKTTGPLRIADAAIAQMEDGQAADSTSQFVPGETIFVSFVAENYKRGTGQTVELLGEIEVLDPAGIPISPKADEKVATTLESEDKDWRPKIRGQFMLPSIARPGIYSAKLSVKDIQSGQTATSTLRLRVVGPELPVSTELAVQQFGFYRTEEEPTALSVAAFTPGDTLWARFFLTGYKYGPENAVDVAYDITVMDPAGKELFTQKNAAREQSKAFYPQPWIPSGMNLSLQKNMRPGIYTVMITVRDNTSKQTISEKHDFRVE